MVNLESHTFFVRARLAFATLLAAGVLSLSVAFYLQIGKLYYCDYHSIFHDDYFDLRQFFYHQPRGMLSVLLYFGAGVFLVLFKV